MCIRRVLYLIAAVCAAVAFSGYAVACYEPFYLGTGVETVTNVTGTCTILDAANYVYWAQYTCTVTQNAKCLPNCPDNIKWGDTTNPTMNRTAAVVQATFAMCVLGAIALGICMLFLVLLYCNPALDRIKIHYIAAVAGIIFGLVGVFVMGFGFGLAYESDTNCSNTTQGCPNLFDSKSIVFGPITVQETTGLSLGYWCLVAGTVFSVVVLILLCFASCCARAPDKHDEIEFSRW